MLQGIDSIKKGKISYCSLSILINLKKIKGLFTCTQLTGLAGLPGPILPWVHIRNFRLVSKMGKGRRSWNEFWREIRETKQTSLAKHKVITFVPIIALATLISVSLQLNGMLLMWKIQQAMRDNAIQGNQN